ncbi:g4589 [Coccomyxa viridis]|uniref:G4589 protein n=1 Tax=Coccomyxa viridis TaxID=1274662 RepID=A0ABP1FVN5_9CHLO
MASLLAGRLPRSSPQLVCLPSARPAQPLRATGHRAPFQVRNVVQHSSFDVPDAAVSRPQSASSSGRDQQGRDAILCSRLKGHQSATTCALVTSDAAGKKEIVTGSLDKTIALWRLEDALPLDSSHVSSAGVSEVMRLTPSGAPVFSLAVDGAAPGSNPAAPDDRQQVFCGNAAKSIAVWEPPASEMQEKVLLNGHTGWVRALAAQGRWLFSAGCNTLRQWDLTRAVPRLVRDVTLEKGDIMGIATRKGFVYTCGADGSIRSWKIGKKGELEPGKAREKAHKDRVTALLAHAGFLYSASYDGAVKMWDADTMELVQDVKRAHEGGRINCATIGADGNLYTGGDDKLVRRWRLGTLSPPPNNALYCHNYSVRALAAGPTDTLVSGDQSGEVAFWRI